MYLGILIGKKLLRIADWAYAIHGNAQLLPVVGCAHNKVRPKPYSGPVTYISIEDAIDDLICCDPVVVHRFLTL